jgi:hypothetical protein
MAQADDRGRVAGGRSARGVEAEHAARRVPEQPVPVGCRRQPLIHQRIGRSRAATAVLGDLRDLLAQRICGLRCRATEPS